MLQGFNSTCGIGFCSMFPKATHETFANKLFETFKNHKRFTKPKLSRTDFIISHYAGEVRILYWYFCVILLFVSIQYFIIFILLQVTYKADLFLDKNKDYVVAEHEALLGSSRCPFVGNLFPPSPEEPSKSSYKFSSIGTRFKVWTMLMPLNYIDTNCEVPTIYKME